MTDTERIDRLEEIFAGNIAAWEQRKAADARQWVKDHERANHTPEQHDANVARAKREQEAALRRPMRQS